MSSKNINMAHFRACSAQKIVKHKPDLLEVTTIDKSHRMKKFSVYIKISETKVKRRKNKYTDLERAFMDDTVHAASTEPILTVRPRSGGTLRIKPTNSGFMKMVETKGGTTAGRKKQHYLLLQKDEMYTLNGPRHRTIIDIVLRAHNSTTATALTFSSVPNNNSPNDRPVPEPAPEPVSEVPEPALGPVPEVLEPASEPFPEVLPLAEPLSDANLSSDSDARNSPEWALPEPEFDLGANAGFEPLPHPNHQPEPQAIPPLEKVEVKKAQDDSSPENNDPGSAEPELTSSPFHLGWCPSPPPVFLTLSPSTANSSAALKRARSLNNCPGLGSGPCLANSEFREFTLCKRLRSEPDYVQPVQRRSLGPGHPGHTGPSTTLLRVTTASIPLLPVGAEWTDLPSADLSSPPPLADSGIADERDAEVEPFYQEVAFRPQTSFELSDASFHFLGGGFHVPELRRFNTSDLANFPDF